MPAIITPLTHESTMDVTLSWMIVRWMLIAFLTVTTETTNQGEWGDVILIFFSI